MPTLVDTEVTTAETPSSPWHFEATVPAAAVPGDLLLLGVVSTSGVDPGHPLGFTDVTESGFLSRSLGVKWMIAPDPVPASVTLEMNSTPSDNIATLVVVRGAHRVDPIDDVSVVSGAASTSCVLPSVTTSKHGVLLVGFVGSLAGVTWTAPGSMTEQNDSSFDAGNGGVSASSAVEVLGAAGATGTRTFVLSASHEHGGVLVAVRGGPWHVGYVGT